MFYISSITNHFQHYVNNSWINYAQASIRDLKVMAIAALVLCVWGPLVYWKCRRQPLKEIFKDFIPPASIEQKVQATFQKSVSKDSEERKFLKEGVEEEKKISLCLQGILAPVAAVAPCSAPNFKQLFHQLAQETPWVEMIPYSYGVQETIQKDELQETKDFNVTRLHYEGWDDHKGITEDDLDRILETLIPYQKDPKRPVIFHCRAGIGRSGTVTVACALDALIKQKKVNESNLMSHLLRLILEGRQQRGPHFVQTPDQLQALWKWSWRALHR